MINKTLVFHLYVYDSELYFDNMAYKMHMLCLKKYAETFNKACFNISVDNINDTKTINRIKHEIIDCGFKNLEIIVTKNDPYCEVNTFKYFIMDRLGSTNDLIFFAHTKGICNIVDGINYPVNILHWIWTMYFYNLEPKFVENMQMRLIYSFGGAKDTFYGTLRLPADEYSSFFSGTFYWINVMKLYEDNKSGKVRIPNIHNRNFCEELPLIYRDETNPYNGIASYYNIFLGYLECYEMNDWNSISMILGRGDNAKYLEGYEQIINQIESTNI